MSALAQGWCNTRPSLFVNVIRSDPSFGVRQVMTAEEYDPVLKQWNADEASITQAHESELAERKCK